ncbi:MAG: 2-hydroxyacyl-CoA dehydratase family protein [Deferrisomatales bacterium]|nr:2-hydroxyacyl-CoA dehydratase family protein [Deferrisomatales bacterium]
MPSPAAPPETRSEYLRRQRSVFGRSLFGVFPAQYPREIFWALGALPVEIWDPPLEIAAAGAHLQPYICSVAQLGLELILQGRCDDLDGFLFPHTCDSLQNLASVVHDCIGQDKPCLFFYNPKEPYGEASRRFYRAQLEALPQRLEGPLGPLDLGRLQEAVALGARVTGLLGELYARRARGELTLSATAFYRLVRRREYLHPEDFVPLLEEALVAVGAPSATARGPTVVLSGILPNPPELLTRLDDLGTRVGNDDLLACGRSIASCDRGTRASLHSGRRIPRPRVAAPDPWEALVESYFVLPPCSTRNSSLAERRDHVLGLVEGCGARGVIFNVVKFCETELFDLPPLVAELKNRGVASLILESELNAGLSGQLATRVEAFVEMLDREAP